MSAFQSTFDSLRGFPRRLSDAAREVRRTASLAGAAMLAALSLVLNQFTIRSARFWRSAFPFWPLERARSCTARGWPD